MLDIQRTSSHSCNTNNIDETTIRSCSPRQTTGSTFKQKPHIHTATEYVRLNMTTKWIRGPPPNCGLTELKLSPESRHPARELGNEHRDPPQTLSATLTKHSSPATLHQARLPQQQQQIAVHSLQVLQIAGSFLHMALCYEA